MEVILQSQEKFDAIAIFNVVTEDFSIHSKADVGKQNLSTQGVFSIHDNTVVCFYRYGNSLFFRLDQNSIEFKNNDQVILEPLSDNRFIFSIMRDKKIIFSWKYHRAEIDPPLSAFQFFSPWTSEEDFDIFLLIHNVINNDERKILFRRET